MVLDSTCLTAFQKHNWGGGVEGWRMKKKEQELFYINILNVLQASLYNLQNEILVGFVFSLLVSYFILQPSKFVA